MADFQSHKREFDALDAEIIALSADAAADAGAMVEQLGIQFDVLCDLDPGVLAATIGTYTATRKGRDYVQPAAFVLKRDGTIVHAVYSSGMVGRLTARDVLTILNDVSK